MKLSIKQGATSQLALIFIQDSSKTDGSGLTGLVFNTSSLVCYRGRADDGNAGGTAISLATATLGTWATGGFKEKDATNMPGVYEIGITNASLAAGSRYCVLMFKGATNMAPCVLEIELTGWDNQDAVHGGMSAIPNTAVTTNASLLTSGTGTDQLSVASGSAKATLSDAVAHGGTLGSSTATLAMSRVNITSQSSNTVGLTVAGNGSGVGASVTGGATGAGLSLVGGATSGDALLAATTSGHGFNITATGTAKDALHLVGAAAATTNAGGHGINATGGASSASAGGTAGFGMLATGGAGSASNNGAVAGVKFIGGGTNTVASAAHGFIVTGTSTGSGMSATSGGGATGDGITATSASTNGNGFSGVGTGTANGMLLTGGNGTNGDGLHCVAGTGASVGGRFIGGGTSGEGIIATATAGNSAGMTLTHQGSGSDFNATTTPLTLAKTTNITGFNDITAAAAATGVWQDATNGDFTVSGSIGKSLFTSGNAPGAASGLALVGSNMGTVTGVTGLTTSTIASAVWTFNPVFGSAGTYDAQTVLLVAAGALNTYAVNDGSPTTTSFATTLGSSVDNYYNDMQFEFITGNNAGLFRVITGYTGSTKTVAFDEAWPSSVANSDVFTVKGPHTHSKSQIATAIWQDATAGDFTTAHSIGKALYVDNIAPGASNGHSLVGSNMGTVASVTAGVTLDYTNAVPTSNTAQTIGDCLNAARAQGFGKWAIVGTTLSLYANDGTTVVRSFTLDSASAPTSRT